MIKLLGQYHQIHYFNKSISTCFTEPPSYDRQPTPHNTKLPKILLSPPVSLLCMCELVTIYISQASLSNWTKGRPYTSLLNVCLLTLLLVISFTFSAMIKHDSLTMFWQGWFALIKVVKIFPFPGSLCLFSETASLFIILTKIYKLYTVNW